jgi:hypothetical protein
MVAHGGTSVAGSFIQTLTMVDVATGWTECMPLLTRESGLSWTLIHTWYDRQRPELFAAALRAASLANRNPSYDVKSDLMYPSRRVRFR